MSIAIAPLSVSPDAARRPVRVMVVDDAVVVRALLARWIDAEPDLEFVASVRNGREAIDQLPRVNPDVVVLDIDMPETDGLTALPQLLAKKRDLIVIMASTLTLRNAEISLRALALGAADYVPKPQTSREIASSSAFHRELIDKIRALALPRIGGMPRRASGAPSRAPAGLALAPQPGPALRPWPTVTPQVLLIGASTGGPQALNQMFTGLGAVIDRVPVLLVQHMPPTFTAVFADHLTRSAGRPVREALDGEKVTAGRVYLAPGNRHMRLVAGPGGAAIALDDGPPVHFCRPAVDPMFASAAEVFGARAFALVLTGMGSDGTRGAGALVAAGGAVMAQDEPTSVVWGMPRSVANAALCSAVLPLDQIVPKLVRLFCGERA